MTEPNKNIEKTLKNLWLAILAKEEQGGKADRVLIGVDLYMEILEYIRERSGWLPQNSKIAPDCTTIYGLPIDVDMENVRWLSVCCTEPVHVEGVENE